MILETLKLQQKKKKVKKKRKERKERKGKEKSMQGGADETRLMIKY